MFYRLAGIVLLTTTLLISACSTDVDNFADYKDITIVYGMLEAGADTTFIKITKAFLGPGNALLIARIPDSSNYPGKLEVQLQGKVGSNTLPPITLDTITIHNKLAGDSVFYFPSQKVYYTKAALNPNATYTLTINKPSGEPVTSTANIVRDFAILQPTNRINFAATTPALIRWNSAENGKRYEVKLVFHYEELIPGVADTVKKTMEWNLGMRRSETLGGGENMEISYLGQEFYNRLGGQLTNQLNVRRFAGPVDVVIACAGDELSTYIDVNSPSNSVVQERPQFTNINNGTGIFSSRRTVVRTYRLSVQSEVKLVEDFNWGFEIKPVP
ncbi:MAG: DUF4249 family protein [Bacteroidetes bacterium]|nr:DUF4249 family protein [Bacteroidota bacterium]